MPDLEIMFGALVDASRLGSFRTALSNSPLGAVHTSLHPLGFAMAKISSSDGTTLRLHLWPRGAKAEQPGYEIHDHSFDLFSHVITGTLAQSIYKAEPQPAGDFAVYQVEYTGSESRLKKQPGRNAVNLIGSSQISQLETYALGHGELHKLAVPSNEPAATIVLTKPRSQLAFTIGPFDGPDSLEFSRCTSGRTALDAFSTMLKR